MLNKLLISLSFALATLVSAAAQSTSPKAIKPTIMVQPSTLWCIDNGYYTQIETTAQGVQKIPDYKAAFEGSRELNLVVSQMGKMMSERGFPLQDMEAMINSINSDQGEEGLIDGELTGSVIAESPVELYNRVAKADIIMTIDIASERRGPRSFTKFNIKALDAYTDKLIAAVQGVGSETSAPIEVQLSTSVNNYMDNFATQLQNHFDDLFVNGREIKVVIMCFEESTINFASEFSYNGFDATLAEIVGVWFEENTVNMRYHLSSSSTNRLVFDGVRMPLMGRSISGREVPIDASGFVKSLTSMLKGEPYESPLKLHQKGLGEVWIILGDE